MGFAIRANLAGIQDVMRELRAVEVKVQKRILKKALRAAGTPMLKTAKALCPVSTEPLNPWKGLLKKSLGIKFAKDKSGGADIALLIVPRYGFRRQAGVRTRGKKKGQPFFQDPSNIAHLVEYGTKHSKAKPFMRPAFDQNKSKSMELFKRVVLEELEKS